MSIFISIASYSDPVLTNTIESAISNADYPNDLYFGVVIQDRERQIPDLSHIQNLSKITMHVKEARGAGYARHLANTLYNNQDYFLQIDSHTLFEKSWDSVLIEELKKAKMVANNDKIILSCYPAPFYVEPNKQIFFIKDSKEQPAYPTRQKLILHKKNYWTSERVEFVDKKKLFPEESNTVLAGFIFADAKLINEVPYDPEISFFGEEVCFAMRAWTRGWDIYSPSKIILHHFYYRHGYVKAWKDRGLKKISWTDLEEISKEKQKKVLCGIESGTYGAGNARSINDYEKFVGIDFKSYYGLTD